MTGGSNIVGLWPDRNAPFEDKVTEAEAPAPSVRASKLIPVIFAVLGFAWLASAIAALYLGLDIARLVPLVAELCAPLILLTALYLIFARGSRVETRRLHAVSQGLHLEQQRLAEGVELATRRLSDESRTIVDVHEALSAVSEEATARLATTGVRLREEMALLEQHAGLLTNATASASGDLAGMHELLPRLEQQTSGMATMIATAGDQARRQAESLGRELDALAARGHEADAIANEGARGLNEELGRIAQATEAAETRIRAATAKLHGAFNDAIAQGDAAYDHIRGQLENEGQAMVTLVTDAEQAMLKTGQDSAAALRERLTDLDRRFADFSALLHGQAGETRIVFASVEEQIVRVDDALAALDETGPLRARRVVEELAEVDDNARRLTERLSDSHGSATSLVERAHALHASLAPFMEAVEVRLPTALDQLASQVSNSRSEVDALAPTLDRMGDTARTTHTTLTAAGVTLNEQRAGLNGFIASSDAALRSSNDAATQLIAALELADRRTRHLSDSVSAQLVEAMVRVRETANAAADRAREAIAAVIPEAAQQLSVDARAALHDAISGEVEQQLRHLADAASAALSTAEDNGRRLREQVDQINASTAEAQNRVGDAREELAEDRREGFAHRVAMLIESLNSTAIDVARLLSTDIPDTAWEAYLRGDRGVFTRRAVRLLDTSEARQLAQNYTDDGALRDQINRFIHDFEAMLRQVLGTREAATLGVTLLSSDFGKLYVALAQAVERLRL